MVKRVFFEFLPFSNMKVCSQCPVSKTSLYGVVVRFETFSPECYSANNTHDIQNISEKLFSNDCQRFCNVKAFYFRQTFQTV